MNHQDYFSLTLDDPTIDRIVEIIQDTDHCKINITKTTNQIWFRGGAAAELRLLFLGTLRLTVSRVNFHHQRTGAMTKILALLIRFCQENQVKEIVVQCVETPEMAAFCAKNRFKPDPHASFQMGEVTLGDYKLPIAD